MLIGLTGGIGSGKSTIAKRFCELGYLVYDTDTRAKQVILENVQVRQKMIELFGEEVYADGKYQTKYVAEKVFNDPDKLLKLNEIVHPATRDDLQLWVRNHPNGYLFVECAILYTSGIDKLCDKVILVQAPEDVCLQRIQVRNQFNEGQARSRMCSQAKELVLQRPSLIINNDGSTSIDDLCEQIIYYLNVSGSEPK